MNDSKKEAIWAALDFAQNGDEAGRAQTAKVFRALARTICKHEHEKSGISIGAILSDFDIDEPCMPPLAESCIAAVGGDTPSLADLFDALAKAIDARGTPEEMKVIFERRKKRGRKPKGLVTDIVECQKMTSFVEVNKFNFKQESLIHDKLAGVLGKRSKRYDLLKRGRANRK